MAVDEHTRERQAIEIDGSSYGEQRRGVTGSVRTWRAPRRDSSR